MSIWIILFAMAPVSAEDTAASDVVEEQIMVPVEGLTIFKYSPAGFQMTQPDGVTTTISETDGGQQLIMFLTESNMVLSADFIASNKTLAEVVEDQIELFSSKDDYARISKEEITLGEKPAYKVSFSYTDEELNETIYKDAVISVNEGLRYVLMSDTDASEETLGQVKELLDSFVYIPVQEDNISKMIKTKMKQMEEPEKGYRSYRSYSYTTYHYYSYSYYNSWCYYCYSPVRYYCWCW